MASVMLATYPEVFAGGALIGRFLYVAGGSSGGSPRKTIERAAVLDPEKRGQVTDLLIEGSEVRAGQQLYQIDPAPYKAAYDSAVAAHVSARALAQRIMDVVGVEVTVWRRDGQQFDVQIGEVSHQQ